MPSLAGPRKTPPLVLLISALLLLGSWLFFQLHRWHHVSALAALDRPSLSTPGAERWLVPTEGDLETMTDVANGEEPTSIWNAKTVEENPPAGRPVERSLLFRSLIRQAAPLAPRTKGLSEMESVAVLFPPTIGLASVLVVLLIGFSIGKWRGSLIGLLLAFSALPFSARFAPGILSPLDPILLIAPLVGLVLVQNGSRLTLRIVTGMACVTITALDTRAGILAFVAVTVADLFNFSLASEKRAFLRAPRLHFLTSIMGLGLLAMLNARGDLQHMMSLLGPAGSAVLGALCLEALAVLGRRSEAGKEPARISLPGLAATALLIAASFIFDRYFSGPDITRSAQRPFTLPGSGEESNLFLWICRVGDWPQNIGVLTSLALPIFSWVASETRSKTFILCCAPYLALLPFAFIHPAYLAIALGFAFPAAIYQLSSATKRIRPIIYITPIAAIAVFCWQLKYDPSAASPRELRSLVERDLAHWLKQHSPSEHTVVVAPPDVSTALRFYGKLYTVGSSSGLNKEGLEVLTAIVSATSAEEAEALLSQHGVTFFILPSWDEDLQRFAAWTLHKPEDALVNALARWAVPPIFRPRSYQLPSVPGFEDPKATIFEVRAESDRAASAADFAEYFLDSNQQPLAAATTDKLRSFPNDLGALVALGRTLKETGDAAEFERTHKTILSMLSNRYAPRVSWRHRVSLAFLLAQTGDKALSLKQTELALKETTEENLRSMDPIPLFKLLKLSEIYSLSFPSQELHDFALSLLPAELRSRISTPNVSAPTR